MNAHRRTVEEIARRIGATIEQAKGSHIKIKIPNGGILVTSCNQNDPRRGIHNFRAELRRKLRETGLDDEEITEMLNNQPTRRIVTPPAPTQPILVVDRTISDETIDDMATISAEKELPMRDDLSGVSAADRTKMVELGAELSKRRHRRSMNQQEAGRRVGVSDSMISRIELGRTVASEQTLASIEREFGFPRGTWPRLARKRGPMKGGPNAQPTLNPAAPPEPPPSLPPEPTPEPEPAPPPTVPAAPALVALPDDMPDRARFLLEVAALHARMSKMGVALVELTPTGVRVQYVES